MFDTDALVRKFNIKMNVFRVQDWSNGLKKETSHWRMILNNWVYIYIYTYIYIYIYIYSGFLNVQNY